MKKFLSLTLSAGLAIATAGPLLALDKTVSSVEVTSNLNAYQNNNVLKFWPTLDLDLEQAIASKLNVNERLDVPGISVEINKVTIDGDTVLPDSGEFNQLEGVVTTNESRNKGSAGTHTENWEEKIGSYSLRLTANSAEREIPDGWVGVAASQDDFYTSLIDGYADAVVERIEE